MYARLLHAAVAEYELNVENVEQEIALPLQIVSGTPVAHDSTERPWEK